MKNFYEYDWKMEFKWIFALFFEYNVYYSLDILYHAYSIIFVYFNFYINKKKINALHDLNLTLF